MVGVSFSVLHSSTINAAWRYESSPACSAARVWWWVVTSSVLWWARAAAVRSGMLRVKAISVHALASAIPVCQGSRLIASASTWAAAMMRATKAALQAAVASSTRLSTANAVMDASYTARATPTREDGSGEGGANGI